MTERQRLAAVMFTDIVGYTSLTQANEAATMKLLDEHRAMLRPFFASHGGQEVKTMGDAFLVEFDSSLEAVRCALEIQAQVRQGDETRARKIQLRIGIHLGEVIHSGGDVYGDAVNIAARLEPLADPGGIAISRQVFELVQNKVDARFARQGAVELKNVKGVVEIYKALPLPLPGAAQLSSPMKMRVAVLPLDNFSPEPGDEYFADGLTEEMIGMLSKIRELSVISRTSVMQYKGKPKAIPDISRELNAGTILEGSVRKAGNRARVSIQMIDATEDRHLWAENYDRDLQDIFAVQSEIAGKVAEALKLELLADEKKELKRVPTTNVEANMLFLRAVYEFQKGSPSDIMKAADYLGQAIEKDPGFAEAYSLRAGAFISVSGELIPGSEGFPKAEKDIERALELDPKLPENHGNKGWLAFQYKWDWAEAEKSLRRALELGPGIGVIHTNYARVLSSLGRHDEAIAEMKKGYELDPANAWTLDHFGVVYHTAGKNKEAREMFDRLLQANPRFVKGLVGLAMVSAAEGKADEAKAEADQAVAIDGQAFFQAHRALVHASVGSMARATEILDNLVGGKYEGYIAPGYIGAIYYSLGDQEKGYEWMMKSMAERDPTIPWFTRWPIMGAAWKDPRFVEQMRKLGLA